MLEFAEKITQKHMFKTTYFFFFFFLISVNISLCQEVTSYYLIRHAETLNMIYPKQINQKYPWTQEAPTLNLPGIK